MGFILFIIIYCIIAAAGYALYAVGIVFTSITTGIQHVLETCRNQKEPWKFFFRRLWFYTKKTVYWILLLIVAFYTAAMINWSFFE